MRQALTSPSNAPALMRYSQVIKAGPHYQCSGMLALDPVTGQLQGEGPGEQARRILSNLILLMKDLSLDLEDLVIARIFVTDLSRFAEVNQAWEEVFSADRVPPARTSLGVAALPLGAQVEIEFTFYKED